MSLERGRPTACDDDIIRELGLAARERRDLYQFRTLAGGHQYVPLYNLLRKYVPPGRTVLDWGAGNGHFSFFLIRAGYDAVGYSLFPSDLDDWLGDGDYRLVPGDPVDPVRLPFEDASFDAVASVGVLEHVRETGGEEVASLQEIRRVLRPEGTFICFHFPNRYSWIDAVARALPGTHHHRYRYTSRDVRDLVTAADLQLLETESYALLPRVPLHKLPERVAHSERFARGYDRADRVLGKALPAVCTNRLFVARK